MPTPLDPKQLLKTLEMLPTPQGDYETYQFSDGKGNTLTIREPLWREYAIGLSVLAKVPDNPFVGCMALLPMLVVDYNGSSVMDVQQIASLPVAIVSPLVERLLTFFRDVSRGLEGDGTEAIESSLSAEWGELQRTGDVSRDELIELSLPNRDTQRSANRKTGTGFG